MTAPPMSMFCNKIKQEQSLGEIKIGIRRPTGGEKGDGFLYLVRNAMNDGPIYFGRQSIFQKNWKLAFNYNRLRRPCFWKTPSF